MEGQFHAAGLRDVLTDNLMNVYGRLPGRDAAAGAILVSAHTDTVFTADTDLSYKQDGTRITGPGIGDNSLGVAALLGLMRTLVSMAAQGDRPGTDIWFCANTREEGLGDLGGIRAAIDRLSDRISACIILEGMAFGQVYNGGIGVRRLRIAASTEGGHSWLHFGQPSAIHALARFAARITNLQPPASPRTTYNIGLIEGGQSVNTIASHASLTLDLRSEDRATLAAFEQQVRDGLGVETAANPGVTYTVEVVGDRAAGSIPADHPLVVAACQAITATRATPSLQSGSTDANLPLSRGIPAVTIGITTGGNSHRTDEFIDTAAIPRGMFQLALLALAASHSLD